MILVRFLFVCFGIPVLLIAVAVVWLWVVRKILGRMFGG
ncbi:hypothetical protein RCH09_003779 [Actimicrobium sp. GrIS 1.19]|nr:hypothetical protein [Actimicrobium sp. GrIS 1.19]